MKSKWLSPDEAAALIKDGDVVAVEGAGRMLLPEAILTALERRFLETGSPRGLTVIHPTGLGDDRDAGMNHFGHEGLVRRVIGGAWGDAPKMGRLAAENKLEAYCFPQGIICQMVEASAARKPRVISHVGLGTFVDPRQQGGKLNDCATEDLVELVEYDGQEYLSFRVPRIDVAILRATTADDVGNLSMEEEPIFLLPLTMAHAASASGGTVLAEVRHRALPGSLNPQLVRVPGINVDVMVQNEDAWQIHDVERYNPAYSGWLKAPTPSPSTDDLDERLVVCRRAALELFEGAVINIGFGLSDAIPLVAAQEGVANDVCLTVEQGTIGGIPSRGRALAAQLNPQAIIGQIEQFNFYQGGGLDLAFLSFAQIDTHGNVNVSKFGDRVIGSGGFIDISQNTKRMIFCGTFAGPGTTEICDGRAAAQSDGRYAKFVPTVEHITFNAERAAKAGQPVLYITERAVFRLEDGGLTLIEYAPGLDPERDVLRLMKFAPRVSPDLQVMDPRIFANQPLELRHRWGLVETAE